MSKAKRIQSIGAGLRELLGSMRFAISLLTLICVASAIGTLVRQHEPWVNYINQFGPFWAGFFDRLDVFRIYNAPWFIGVMAFLVVSTSLCVWRNTPKMMRDMRAFRETLRESSLLAFSHRWQGVFTQPVLDLQPLLVAWLTGKGYRIRCSERDTGVMIAAKKGAANRLGYVLTHVAIVVICVGGLLDSGIPLKLWIWMQNKQPVQGEMSSGAVPTSARLGANTLGYRGHLLLPEGESSRVALLDTGNGLMVQDLPFVLTLKQFRIDFYSTGMPKLFASDVEVLDSETGKRFDATIEVNKPLVYRGVTVYQSSFEDGGTKVDLNLIPLGTASTSVLKQHAVVGTRIPLSGFENQYALELTGFTAMNVESMPTSSQGEMASKSKDKQAHVQSLGVQAFQGELARVIGPGVAKNVSSRFVNVGPSLTYKLRDKAGQASEFKTYMLPVVLEGRSYFLMGMRTNSSEDFRFLRIPADEFGRMDQFWHLRDALQNASWRELAVDRLMKKAFLVQQETTPDLQDKVRQSAIKVMARFAGQEGSEQGFGPAGLAGIAAFLDESVPEGERENVANVLMRLLQGGMWELYQISRVKAGLSEASEELGYMQFVQDAQLGLSDLSFFRAPVLVQLDQFDEVKASVFQVSRAPGQWVVYLGCLLLVMGVFSMFYIRDRRVFVWLSAHETGSRVWMGMSTTRQTLDFDQEFQALVNTLETNAEKSGLTLSV